MSKKKRRATMKDVAEAAGVSRTTVSFVLNNLPDSNIPEATRQRIILAARALNYVPNVQALSLAKGKSMMVGLIVRQTSEQFSADAFVGEFIRGITRAIEPSGFHLLVHTVEPRAKGDTTYGELVRTRKIDGLIITSPMVNDPEVRVLHDEGTPIVIHGAAEMDDIPSVDVDNTQGAFTAVKHLIELGHRRIAHISNAPFSYTSSRDRLIGYQSALEAMGLPYDEALVDMGQFTDTSGYAPMQRLLDLPEPPTAVFVGSDVVSLGAFEAIYERGLSIPNDISVIGFDDIALAKYLRPPLTTIHLPAFELGRQASEMLLHTINGVTLESLHVLLPTGLFLRQSTAPFTR